MMTVTKNPKTPRKLFLDDERLPPVDGSAWVIVRSYNEAVAWVEANEFPRFVSFDNDLGEGVAEGWQFAQYLIERDLDCHDMPNDFAFWVHSQNPVRRADIEDRLNHYLAFRADAAI